MRDSCWSIYPEPRKKNASSGLASPVRRALAPRNGDRDTGDGCSRWESTAVFIVSERHDTNMAEFGRGVVLRHPVAVYFVGAYLFTWLISAPAYVMGVNWTSW